MKYGSLPPIVGQIEIECKEMMFYQYLPIKLTGQTTPTVEKRLEVFNQLIGKVCCDFIGEFGLDNYTKSYVYLTAKRGWQKPNCSYNREGWHSDGFLTEDINYIWCDSYPTVFNYSDFNLTLDDKISLKEMEEQADPICSINSCANNILRLNQYHIHKVATITEEGMRTFVKISFSKDKYDLEGNSHNYELEYSWDMKPRSVERNIPQNKIS